MRYHIEKDNQFQKYPRLKDRDLPWTLWDDTYAYGFYETKEEAVAAFAEIVDSQQDDIEQLRRALEDAHDELEDAEYELSEMTLESDDD